ncbi:MAG: NADH-quinone oxidoreductase subunit C [Chitinivibrionales bacterium]|nr:NADH-quinone oxidoreductase subunit C [Chitinivibrionales bacterium]
MTAEQTITNIEVANLIEQCKKLIGDGYRLVQIGATKLVDGIEVNYSFDKGYNLQTLRLKIASSAENIPSISAICFPAFLYENELHDLFGLAITGIAVDYQGKFYQTSIPTPFNTPAAKEEA